MPPKRTTEAERVVFCDSRYEEQRNKAEEYRKKKRIRGHNLADKAGLARAAGFSAKSASRVSHVYKRKNERPGISYALAFRAAKVMFDHGGDGRGFKDAEALLEYLRINDTAHADEPAHLASVRTALEELYRSTNGDSWKRRDNWCDQGARVSTWFGVEEVAGRVTSLKLDDNNLEGRIPDSIGELTALRKLRLGRNRLKGPIPETIGRLENLEDLVLGANQLETIPESIGQLGRLKRLELNNNELFGAIPETMGNLQELQILDVCGNRIRGDIRMVRSLRKLVRLDLSRNRLGGGIPALEHLKCLRDLDLNDNMLIGSIPKGIGELPRLQNVLLDHNELEGNIPEGIVKLLKLRHLRLDHNRLEGSIPEGIVKLPELRHLRLDHNRLEGSIPAGIGKLSRLRELSLDHNRLDGSIPEGIGKLSKLQHLSLNDNRLAGEIPKTLGGLEVLRKLALGNEKDDGNRFRIIPEEAFGGMPKLEELELANARLRGSIPKSITGLYELRMVSLGGNELSGEIPEGLGEPRKDPNAEGAVPALEELDLRCNNLTGPIPKAIGNLKNLKLLVLSGNQLEGEIPGDFDRLAALEKLRLNDNRLTGDIPDALGRLQRLRILDISCNGLSGRLPGSFRVLLKTVEEVDVRDNEELIVTTGDSEQAHSYSTRLLFGPRTCDVLGDGPAGDAGEDVSRDHVALTKLYDATNGDRWSRSTNWKSKHPLNSWGRRDDG